MSEMRMAVPTDAELIGQQRRRMFVDMGETDDARMQTMVAKFVPWVRAKLDEGTYLGWLIAEGERIIAGGGMWLMECPPNLIDEGPVRAHLMNFYVEPAFRGRGLAYELLQTAMNAARGREINVISLHASKFGRPLYERNGFEPTNEMRRRSQE